MRLMLRILVVLPMFLFMLSSAVVHASDTLPWLLESSHGDVYARPLGNTSQVDAVAVVEGALLQPPFEVLTGRQAKATLTRGDDRLEIAPQSVVEFKVDSVDADGIVARIRQVLGLVLYQVDKIAGRGFEVETPYLVSVVKGTSFSVRVGKRAAGVALAEGRLYVMNGNRESGVMIEPGQTAYFNPDDQRIHVDDTIELGPDYERLLSRASARAADGGLADPSGWSVMSIMAPLSSGISEVQNDTLVQAAADTLQSSVEGLAGGLDAAADTLSGALSDTLGGLPQAGFDTGAGQLIGSGPIGGQLGAGQGIDPGILPGVPELEVPPVPPVPPLPPLPPLP